jgi:cyd operon protein YbgT
MWYFSWILGTGLALGFGILNAIWYEILESQREAAANPAATHPPVH